ncbi:TniB family NTP-binding protein [Deinococcus altitudinis]|uniref:TniB family NTP-binding protein n=1 Tax=Deinococcus altitudinis TaxID=468914 RepID=UPI00389255ED
MTMIVLIPATTPEADAAEKAFRDEVIRRRETCWVKEPSRVELLKELHYVATTPQHRKSSIAIIAEANSGKSAILRKYQESYPSYERKDRTIVPSILIDLSTLKRVEDLSIALLKKIGAIDPESGNHTQRLERFTALAGQVGLGLVMLDEFHEVADTSGKGKPFLKCIKSLMNEGIAVVPAGVDEVRQVFRGSGEFTTRFDFELGTLKPVEDEGIVLELMMHISALPLTAVPEESVKYVMCESRGVFGHVCDLIQRTFIAHRSLTVPALTATRKVMRALDPLP